MNTDYHRFSIDRRARGLFLALLLSSFCLLPPVFGGDGFVRIQGGQATRDATGQTARLATTTSGSGENRIDTLKTDGGGGGGGGAVTIADGADATQGAKADAAVTNPALSASEISLLKGLLTQLLAATPAGTNLIGKVGIDQTTPGTTNAVAITGAQYTIAMSSVTTSGSVAAGKHHIEFILSTDFSGSIGGVTMNPATLSIYNPGDAPVGSSFAALSYTISAGNAVLTTW